MAELDFDEPRHRDTYLEARRRQRAELIPQSLKFGDPGGRGRRITPVADGD